MNSRRRFGTGTLISRTVTLQDSFNVLTQEILLGTNPYRIFLIEFSASSLAKKTRRRDSNSAEFFPRISRNVNLTLSTATAGLVASANTRRPQLLPSPVAGTAVLQKLRRRQSLPLRSSNWRLRRCSAGTVAATWLRITELRCRITPAPLRTMLARRAVAENATTDRCTAAMARREEFSRKQKPKTKKNGSSPDWLNWTLQITGKLNLFLLDSSSPSSSSCCCVLGCYELLAAAEGVWLFLLQAWTSSTSKGARRSTWRQCN